MNELHHLLETAQVRHLDKATTFSHPDEVLANSYLTVPEKRGLLASWLSDANTVPNLPTQRQLPDGSVVTAEDILRALRTLDAIGGTANAERSRTLPWCISFERRRGRVCRNAVRPRRGPDDDDPPPCPAFAMPRSRGRGGSECANEQLVPA